MTDARLYTLHQISEMLDIPIQLIEWYINSGLVTVEKRDRKGNSLVSEAQIQRVYDLYSTRYSYLSDDEFEKVVHGYR